MTHSRTAFSRTRPGSSIRAVPAEGIVVERQVSTGAKFVLSLFSLATFLGFMLLDPNPSFLLSTCAAANVAIMLSAIYRLYQWDLLLSPMMIAFIGPTMLLYYSWGNLGARMAGAGRYAANFGTLEYYPLVALLSTVGLILYCWVVFGVFQRAIRRVTVRYQDLYWRPRHAIAAISLVIANLAYLTIKYRFTGGYFRNAESTFDRWLIATTNASVLLAVVICVSVLARAIDHRGRLWALVGLGLSVVLAIGLRSRTFMVLVLVLMALCWLTLRPKQASWQFILVIGVAGVVVFSLGAAVKVLQGETDSVLENLKEVSSLQTSQIVAMTNQAVEIDRQYRVGGFEYPAAILRCLGLGAAPAYGRGLEGAVLQGLPGFVRPAGSYSERGNLALHFLSKCRFLSDSMALPLASGLGDWGIPGVLMYAVFGVFNLLLWRVAQSTPRLFVAFVIMPFFPDSLFWDGLFTYVKTMSFLWLVLWMLGPILMPRWLRLADDPAAARYNT